MDFKERIDSGELVPITDMELSTRSYNCLNGAGINFVNELLCWHELDLLKLPNLGRVSINEIKDVLELCGLSLSESHIPNITVVAAELALKKLLSARDNIDHEIELLKKHISDAKRGDALVHGPEALSVNLDVDITTYSFPGLTYNENTAIRERSIGKTLKDVAAIMGVTKERVRQLEGRACRKLRHPDMKPYRPIIHRMGLCIKIYGECACSNKEPIGE